MLPLLESRGGREDPPAVWWAINNRASCLWYMLGDDQEVSTLAILRVQVYASGLRVLNVQYAAGRVTDFYGTMGQLENVARVRKCAKIQFDGRKGWARVLSKRFREYSRSFELEVTGGE